MKSRMLSMHGNGTRESEGKLGMVGAILLAPLAVLPRPPSRSVDTLRRLSLLAVPYELPIPTKSRRRDHEEGIGLNRLAQNLTMTGTGLHFAS